jgi:intermediate cleaving peptidase 55
MNRMTCFPALVVRALPNSHAPGMRSSIRDLGRRRANTATNQMMHIKRFGSSLHARRIPKRQTQRQLSSSKFGNEIFSRSIYGNETILGDKNDDLDSLGPLGQATPWTHPHLLQPNEVTPGINRTEYAQRRSRLMQDLPDGSIVVIGSYGVRYMTNGIFYPFHQNTDLLYLTGCEEPHVALVMIKHGNDYKSHLFLRPRDKRSEQWDGPRIGLQGATDFLGMDQAHVIDSLPTFLQGLVDDTVSIYTDLPIATKETEKFSLFSRKQAHSGYSVTDPSKSDKEASFSSFVKNLSLGSEVRIRPIKPLIQELRLVKSEAEGKLLLKAGQIAGKGFQSMMQHSSTCPSEHHLHAHFELSTRLLGAKHQAYVPVVASGTNALILHYVWNQGALKHGDLVLVDAGVTFGGYVSDVTRTWPVSGRFTPHQRALYSIVLKAQLETIEAAKESANVSLDELHRMSLESMQIGVGDLFGRSMRRLDMDKIYPHHVGHWMGMDVHDCDSIHRSRKLRRGHTITLEPGLYIPVDSSYPPEFQGMGIRIEDDVLIGLNDNVVLSADAPKHPDDIEAICSIKS